MTYKNWRPGSRRDRRRQAGGARSRRRTQNSGLTVYIVLGVFAALLIALLIALAIATR